MVLGVISSEGDVMPPHMFQQCLRVNANGYTDVLKSVVKPWMEELCRKTISLSTGFRSYSQNQDDPSLVDGERSAPPDPRLVAF